MITAVYLRVSTEDQNIDSQRAELREVCTVRGWKDPVEFTDRISGSKTTRAGLDALMKAVRGGRVARIVCFKLDRLGRSLAHLAQLIGEFDQHKVALVIPGQGIDTTSDNPAARFQLNILSAVAEFERSLIRERTKAGLSAARARGVKLGRSKGSKGKPSAKKTSAFKLLDQRADLTVEEIAESVECSIGSAWTWKREWLQGRAARDSIP